MISYAMSKCFRPYHVVAWDDARQLVDLVQADGGNQPYIRCHELARAVLLEMSEVIVQGRNKYRDALEVHDGKVGHVEHSWLRFTKSGVVIDVYRPGLHPQVLLVDSIVAMDYKFIEMRTDIDNSVITKLRLMMQK